jgi:hypothetical protein
MHIYETGDKNIIGNVQNTVAGLGRKLFRHSVHRSFPNGYVRRRKLAPLVYDAASEQGSHSGSRSFPSVRCIITDAPANVNPEKPNITALYYENGQIFSMRMKKTKKAPQVSAGWFIIKTKEDERTGGAVARPAASEWSGGRHPKGRKEK